MQNKIFLLFLFLNACLCYSQNPWLQGKGDVVLSPSISHYYTDSQRNESGVKSDFSNNGYYKNYVYKLYFATSIIPNKLSLIGNLPYVQSTYQDDFNFEENNELGDFELGVKMHLTKLGENHYLMGAFTTVIPLYNNNKGPFVGFDRFGTELKINISGNSKWLDINKNYHQLEMGVKVFYPGGPYQFKMYASQGYRFAKKFVALGDLDIFLSRGEDFSVSQENILVTPDFDIVKATLSLGYEFTPNFALYAGGFKDVWNRNVAVGSGWQIFSVIKL